MITKSMILPIISVVALMLQSVFHINLTDTIQNEIATAISDVILVSMSIYGIIKDHKASIPQTADQTKQNNLLP